MLKESIPLDVSAYIIIADENHENLGKFYRNRETLDGMFQSLTEVEGYNFEQETITTYSCDQRGQRNYHNEGN